MKSAKIITGQFLLFNGAYLAGHSPSFSMTWFAGLVLAAFGSVLIAA